VSPVDKALWDALHPPKPKAEKTATLGDVDKTGGSYGHMIQGDDEARVPAGSPEGGQFTREHAKAAIENGGITVDPRTGQEITTGYSAARQSSASEDVEGSPTAAELHEFVLAHIAKHPEHYAHGTGNLGVWYDQTHKEEDGTIVPKFGVEPGDNYRNKVFAKRVGKRRNQKEIWDHAKLKGIKTGGDGTNPEHKNQLSRHDH
jgi:hypothetical protein